MYKAHFFLAASGDPFAVQGSEAEALVRQLAPEVTGYVQSRAGSEQLGDDIAYQGVAECWFGSDVAALWAGAAMRDCALWAPGAQVKAVVVGRERTVLRTARFAHGRGVKGVFPFLRRADFEVADFQHYWWHRHGPIAARTESADGYLQCHPLHASYEQRLAGYDGVTELFWPDFAAAKAAMASDQMTVEQSTDAKNFVDTDSVALFFAEEEVVIAP